MSEDLIVRHCAPTLAGLKTGNMFSASFADEKELKAVSDKDLELIEE